MSARSTHSCTARAHSNIALIKYWGKRDDRLKLPAVGSISMTLDALYTDTRVSFFPGAEHDSVDIGGRKVDPAPFTAFLDLVRAEAGIEARMLLQVHDELIFEAEESIAEAAVEAIRAVMESAADPVLDLAVPLVAEAGIADSWADAH